MHQNLRSIRTFSQVHFAELSNYIMEKKFESVKTNFKKMWQVINSVFKKSSQTMPNTFHHCDRQYSDPQEIANLFNSYSVNIVQI